MNLDELHGESGYQLIDGYVVWSLHATHGIALEISLPMVANQGYIPTWDKLLDGAYKDGADISRLIDRICNIIGDSYNERVAAIIREWLPKFGVDKFRRGNRKELDDQ